MKRNYIYVIIGVILLSVGSSISIKEKLEISSKEFNEMAPIIFDSYKVGSYTTIISQSMNDKEFYTHMKVDVTQYLIDYESTISEWKESQHSYLKSQYCSLPAFQYFRENNITGVTKYSNWCNKHIHTFHSCYEQVNPGYRSNLVCFLKLHLQDHHKVYGDECGNERLLPHIRNQAGFEYLPMYSGLQHP